MDLSRDRADAELGAVLRATRAEFIDNFERDFDALRGALERIAAGDADAPRAQARHTLHRMAGLAGMVGLPAVGERAADLESLIGLEGAAPVDPGSARAGIGALRAAFDAGVTTAPGPAPARQAPPEHPCTIAIVEDDAAQRALLAGALTVCGHAVVTASDGLEAPAILRSSRPDVILVDVNLPGQDGLALCRQIKTDPQLHAIPVIFVTTRASVDDRVAALTVGADDYLIKPVDAVELRLRVEVVLRRRRAAAPDARVEAYVRLAPAAVDLLAAGPAALALIRVTAGPLEKAATAVFEEMRHRDRLGYYDEMHLLLVMPGLSAEAASERLRSAGARLAASGHALMAGIAATGRAGERDFPSLLREADELLASARASGQPMATAGAPRTGAHSPPRQRTVLIADDDAAVVRILESQVRGAGYRTLRAADGREALRLIHDSAPDAVLLDLMLPRMTGFDVLQSLARAGTPRPRILVVSARGRDADVTRAFDLGADDYLTKPFSPHELLARLTRSLR